MFRGLHSLIIDAKNRVTVPSKYRQKLIEEDNGQFVLTIHPDDCCLLLYTSTQWRIIEEKLTELPSLQMETKKYQRLLIGHAFDLEMDRTGRILLPEILQNHAGFDKTIMWVGLGNKVELWGEQQWTSARENWLVTPTTTTIENPVLPPELISLSL